MKLHRIKILLRGDELWHVNWLWRSQKVQKEGEQQLKHSRTASQKERLQMLWWLKTGQITQHKTLAERLGRDGSTVTRWLQKYRQGGLSELLTIKSARVKIASLERRGSCRITKKTGTVTRIQKLRRNRGVAQGDLSTEPDIPHSLSLGTLSTQS